MNSNPQVEQYLQILANLNNNTPERNVVGLDQSTITSFLQFDLELQQAIKMAKEVYDNLSATEKQILTRSEDHQIEAIQDGFLNFYAATTLNPYVALAAKGPWVISSTGAVVFDCGGYGMLGLGHNPKCVLDVLSKPMVMANIMTANVSQKRLVKRLRESLGGNRPSCPFDRFICLNSGSESMTVATRIADANALVQTGKGGPKENWKIKSLALKGAFHGRTDRPARVSHSCRPKYSKYLASFRDLENLLLVTPNDCDELRAIFRQAEEEHVFIEAMLFEPVQGEGNPGALISREFYDLARKLTMEHGGMLIADSIQAGLRGQGCLSIIDYEGFEDCQAPDMETWSKALNAGQYPLSVLGLTSRAAKCYSRGLYGNTMTTNPRALEVACAVLDKITPTVQKNIRERGKEFLAECKKMQQELPHIITHVQGTGLLFSMELDEKYPVVDVRGIERICREKGLGIIHGGSNALRFTPGFETTSEQVKLIMDIVRDVLQTYQPS